jgi:hypothetical protein
MNFDSIRTWVRGGLTVGGAFLLAVSVVPPAHAASGLTGGDLVVERVQSSAAPGSTAGSVFLDQYSTSANGYTGTSITLPPTTIGSQHRLVESGSATNDGEITLSSNGNYILVPGYDNAVGTTKLTSASPQPKVIGVVTVASGAVDTSTDLTDTAIEGSSTSKANFRTAAGSGTDAPLNNGTPLALYDGGDAGAGVVGQGGSTDTYVDTTDSIDEEQLYNGNLYASDAASIVEIGSGLPTTASADTTLVTAGAPAPAKFAPDGFVLLDLGGCSPDTIYAADNTDNAIEKFSLVGATNCTGGTWTAEGSVTVDSPNGLVASVSGNNVTLYTTTGAGTATFQTQIQSMIDTAGPGATMNVGSSLTTLDMTTSSNSPANGADASFKGLVLVPTTQTPVLPEAPLVALLPATGGAAMIGLAIVLRRRRRRGAASLAT